MKGAVAVMVAQGSSTVVSLVTISVVFSQADTRVHWRASMVPPSPPARRLAVWATAMLRS
jgi:hypothetical protein